MKQPEALRRIESSASTVLETFKTFIRRASLLLINKSAIPHLLKKVSEYNDLDEGCQEAARVAETLLSFMAKRLAVMFSSYQDNLVLAADSEDEPRVVKVALMAASELKRVKAESFGEQMCVV